MQSVSEEEVREWEVVTCKGCGRGGKGVGARDKCHTLKQPPMSFLRKGSHDRIRAGATTLGQPRKNFF
jgi:hypothetical protein